MWIISVNFPLLVATESKSRTETNRSLSPFRRPHETASATGPGYSAVEPLGGTAHINKGLEMTHLRNCEIATRKPFFTATSMAAVVALGAAALIAAPALASPGSGVTSTVLATGDLNETVNINHDRVKFQTKDPTDVRVQRLDFAAGAFTGWHHHPGIVIVTVASGLITTVQADCSTRTYGPGSPNGSVFVEGHDEPMEARSTAGGTVYATYVAPDASPPVFRIEDPAQTCSSATSFRTPPGK